jgi:hypothetical protein
VGEFKPHEEVAEATERVERSRTMRWTPIAAAIVAVLAALSNLASNQRSTEALIAKNESIAALTHASDTYNYYQAKSIKEELYKAAIVTAGKKPALEKVVEHEHESKAPILEKAREYDKEAAAANERSERYLHSHDTLEIGVTFLEVGIVILSIASLVGTLALPIVAAGATAVGVGFTIAGLPV